jgi:hypothetical protein
VHGQGVYKAKDGTVYDGKVVLLLSFERVSRHFSFKITSATGWARSSNRMVRPMWEVRHVGFLIAG